MGETMSDQDTTVNLGLAPLPDALHDGWHFHAITNARAHEEVVKQITFAILSGTFLPGERLPNIEQLAHAMGVSKPVIGEALKILAREKIVRVQRGSSGGVFVETDNVPDSVMGLTTPLRHLNLAEIVEARHPVELQLALLAGQRGTETDFQTLQACIDRLEEHRDSPLSVRIRFARAARSGALAMYQHQILEQLFVRMHDYFSNTEDVDRVIEEHQRTLDAIRSREPASITAAIASHMSLVEEAAPQG
jgi:GntR family transcriptional repressor for pyruvate dehydrogenase complex